MENLIVLTTLPQNEEVKRIYTNRPELRHGNIINALSEFCQIVYPEQTITFEVLQALNVHDRKMV
jgi:hypothetical protein